MKRPWPLPSDLEEVFGDIDIYLFDQLLKGRFTPGMRVLDAGCGGGRNLKYLMRSGYEVFGIDTSPARIEEVRSLAATLAPHLPSTNFKVESVTAMSFPDSCFDALISSAVFHFAADEEDFYAMLNEMWRVLKPAGILFCRQASTIGIEDRVVHRHGRHFLLPDGTERFLIDEAMLLAAIADLGGTLIEPIKTVNVQNERCMTTWCARKG